MKILMAAMAASLCVAAPAGAATIVDTGVPTSGGSGYTLSPIQELASRFSLASATSITSVAGFISGWTTGNVTIAIRAGDALPGNVLYSGGFAATPTFAADFQGLSGLDWTLGAGNYWVSFASTGGHRMPYQAPSPLKVAAYKDVSNNVWYRSDSINLGIRIGGVPAAVSGAVPEPASWALMIVGFGAVGATMRRRRARVAVRFA